MKSEVTKAQSMFNYNIKAKHMGTMSSFLASKNFELHTRLPTPPPETVNKNDKTPPVKAATLGKDAAGKEKKGSGLEQRKGSTASQDSEALKVLIVKENIE